MNQINMKPQPLLTHKINFLMSRTIIILNTKTISPLSLEGGVFLSISRKKNCRTARNFCLKFWFFQQHYLWNILISSSLKSKIFSAWQNSNLEWYSMLAHERQIFFNILFLFVYLLICLLVYLNFFTGKI